MNPRAFSVIIIVSVFALLIITACASTPSIPPDEQKYIEGTMIEGGAFSFRLKDAHGNVKTYAGYHNAEYSPVDFHALFGDRLGVTYGTVMKMDKQKNVAVKVSLLATGTSRLEINSPATGIIREAGKTRHKIHLPDYDVTAVMLKGRSVSRTPDGWKAEKGNQINVWFTEEPSRFMKKTYYYALELQAKGPANLNDHTLEGVVSDIGRGSITITKVSGGVEKLSLGRETEYTPSDYQIQIGHRVKVTYYRKLMGDRSIQLTAILVEPI